MGIFGNLFDHRVEQPALLPAIERAVSVVEPLLKQVGGYPDNYRKPVAAALEYAHLLAAKVPGPVTVDRRAYASDDFVHALFPDIGTVAEAIRSSQALQDYQRDFPASDELYALMGMRRIEKSVVGMELSGLTVQRDVLQQAVYFTSHTIDHPAPSEQQARELAAMSFFDSLVRKVKKRVEQRKRDKQAQLLEKELLTAQLHMANGRDSTLEHQLAGMVDTLQTTVSSLELSHYAADFDAVLLHPEEHLSLKQTAITLDSMGIRRAADDVDRGRALMFNDLIGYDRRDWTVTMVRCSNLQNESFAEKLDKAYRRLAI
ncbi:MAG: hypothetical protein HY016_13195 [Nitrosomonadales bacterium]|nr:hypothetical protein [Nitrosomonadales bacterium]